MKPDGNGDDLDGSRPVHIDGHDHGRVPTTSAELIAINDELTALNAQLREALDRERSISDDLQNVLYSTNIATLFLDRALCIRFFTPAIKSVFNILPSDIGRPLADLRPLVEDDGLLADVATVLQSLVPNEIEVAALSGAWFERRAMPYRAHDNAVGGVVVTYTDVSERHAASIAFKSSMRQSELANIAKSRFLAAASHDLRQPLQTLVFIHGRLEEIAAGSPNQPIVDLMAQTLSAMAGMLNTMLDINQIEAGIVRAQIDDTPVGDLLDLLALEFKYVADAKDLKLRVMHTDYVVRSDRHLLEQMVRNLISNALKYTEIGKVLVGCRRRGNSLHIEIWDSGIGIADHDLKAVFDEYHQAERPNRGASHGLGLGLSIVQRLAILLGHRIDVWSRVGRGSRFSIVVDLAPLPRRPSPSAPNNAPAAPLVAAAVRQVEPISNARVLVVEDDPNLRALLQTLLTDAGYLVTVASDTSVALSLAATLANPPNLILADFNLPGEINGLELAMRMRQHFGITLPVIVLTGDISASTLRAIQDSDCIHLNKPVKPRDLIDTIERQISEFAMPAGAVTTAPARPVLDAATVAHVYVIDDDANIREHLSEVLWRSGYWVELFASAEAFLEAHQGAMPRANPACVLIDAYLPGISGMDVLTRLRETGDPLPAIMITGRSDVKIAVQAMKAGARDFIEKPFDPKVLLASISNVIAAGKDENAVVQAREAAIVRLSRLTVRERQIMDMVLEGHPNKNIAADLGISQRTVENHRASVMSKTGVKSLPALARLAVTALDT